MLRAVKSFKLALKLAQKFWLNRCLFLNSPFCFFKIVLNKSPEMSVQLFFLNLFFIIRLGIISCPLCHLTPLWFPISQHADHRLMSTIQLAPISILSQSFQRTVKKSQSGRKWPNLKAHRMSLFWRCTSCSLLLVWSFLFFPFPSHFKVSPSLSSCQVCRPVSNQKLLPLHGVERSSKCSEA